MTQEGQVRQASTSGLSLYENVKQYVVDRYLNHDNS